ncbi:MAG: hypothetical protein CUN55_13205 [Phototrophicales bacterium]|nr:MAG: hypothetical protein CUN55_13205 [Phototrophicales bacterium]
MIGACTSNSDEKETPQVLRASPNFIRQTDLALTALAETATSTASFVPTVTPFVPTATIDPARIVTFTPKPTVAIRDREDILGNSYPQQSWLEQPFITTDGVERRLRDFSDSVIIVRTLTTDCDQSCLDMQLTLRQIAENTSDLYNGAVVFITLNTNTTVSARSLEFWADNHNIGSEPQLNWYVGTISSFLQRDLVDTFGDSVLEPQSLSLIVVDQGGISHISQNQVYRRSQLSSIIGFYVFGGEEAEEDLDDEPSAAEASPTPSPVVDENAQ